MATVDTPAKVRLVLGQWESGAPEAAVTLPRDSKRAKMFFDFLKRSGFDRRAFTADTTRGRRMQRKMRPTPYAFGLETAVFALRPYDWDARCNCGLEAEHALWSKSNPHAEDCYQNILERRTKEVILSYGVSESHQIQPLERYRQAMDAVKTMRTELCLSRQLDPDFGCLVHCTCGHDAQELDTFGSRLHAPSCRDIQPNFLHKPSGLALYWYKYPLRSAKLSHHVTAKQWAAILNDCRHSLKRL